MSETKARLMSFKVGVKRNYGKHEVYFELAEQAEISTGSERREIMQRLHVQLNDEIKRYETYDLPHVKLPAGSAAAGSAAGSSGVGDAKTFKLKSILVEHAGGKRRVRAIGGQFEKHGIPVYEECDTAIPTETLSFGLHDYSKENLTVTVEFEGGKPKRARSIK